MKFKLCAFNMGIFATELEQLRL